MTARRERIEQLLLRLIACRSDTGTVLEKNIEEIILNWLKARPYFKNNPHYLGTRNLFNDKLEREVVWALVKGTGNKTVILMHHHDAIDIEEFGRLKYCALRPDELQIELAQKKLAASVKKDLESKEWLFGRGSADMKAGAAIQLTLLEEFSELSDFEGNILLLSVPDEESISKGMLSAVELLCEVREKYNLDYILTVNSEPYFSQVKNKAIMYEGSVGKIMPVVFVKGVKSHISEPFSGVSPSLILANIQSLSELNVKLCDVMADEATPPPVWVNLKDRKKAYDASIPDAASGYFNWLTFSRPPATVMNTMMEISQQALDNVMNKMKESWLDFCKLNNTVGDELDFNPRILDFKTLHNEALLKGGDNFLQAYETFQNEINETLLSGQIVLPEATIRLIEFTADYVDLEGPAIVIAVSGPYYPHVNNLLINDGNRFNLEKMVNEISQNNFGIEFVSRPYFMGISDLSYASWVGNDSDISMIKENSPGWDSIYRIPFKALRELQMPVVNIGPWGKDLHKTTERVYLKDVYERIPKILTELILKIL